MKKIEITALELAERFLGVEEVKGQLDNPFITSMLTLDAEWPEHDEVPWCSAFVNYIAWLLKLPRSKSLLARSWLNIGTDVSDLEVEAGFDVVILSRGDNPAAGHVGFFVSFENDHVNLLGGNQGDAVSLKSFDVDRVVGYRRLYNG